MTDGLITKHELSHELKTEIENATSHQNDLTYQNAGGTATVITLTIDVLKDGYAKTFIAVANNNGAVTTINGKSLYKPNTTSSPTLVKGKAYTIWYSSTNDCFFIKASADGNATADKVLAGNTFSNDNETGLTGEMPNIGAIIIMPSTLEQTIPSGYHNGLGKVKKANIVNAGESLLTSNSAFKSTTATVMTKIKATQINVSGIVRVKFDLSSVNGYKGTLQIYVNGIPIGTERNSSSASYVTYTEDISIEANDIIEIWGKCSSGANVNCNNLGIYYLGITGTNILL